LKEKPDQCNNFHDRFDFIIWFVRGVQIRARKKSKIKLLLDTNGMIGK